MQNELGKLLQALAFFSRLILPERLWRLAAPLRLHQCAPWFPVAGLLIALPAAALWWIASLVLPTLVAATLAIAAAILATGALHEDGLADTIDGLGGGATRESALEIMRDSRIGAYGALALLFSVLLRIAPLASLSPAAGLFALLAANSAARGTISIALAFSTYARTQGTGSLVSPGISRADFGFTAAISALLGLGLGGLAGLFAVVAGFCAAALLLWRCHRRIGGYTGDALGAMEQVAEVVVLLVLAALWGHA